MNTCFVLKTARTLDNQFLVPVAFHGRGSKDWHCPDSFAENISFSERNESLMADFTNKKHKSTIGLFSGNRELFFERGQEYCSSPGGNN
jgi:hypothetical protein